MKFSRKLVALNALCALLFIAVFILITPQTYLLGQYKIPSDDIRFLAHSQSYLMDDYINPENVRPHRKQFLESQGKSPRRYNFYFDENTPVSGAKSIYIPSLTEGAHMSINGIPFGPSETLGLFSPGLGQDWLIKDIPRTHLTPGNNRIDLHAPKDTQRSGLREVYLGPTKIINDVAAQQRRWTARLPKVGLGLSALGCLICIIGLLFGKFKNAFAVMGAIAALSLLQFLQTYLPSFYYSSSANYVLKLAIPTGILTLLFIWYRLPKRTDNLLKPIQVLLLIFAALGPIYGLLAMLFPYPMPGVLLGASWTLASILPLLLLWSLLSLFQDLNERRSILEALQLKVSAQEQLLDEKSRVIADEMRKRAILEERQRFTRDIHDGIGGQLLSLLLKIRSGKANIDTIAAEVQAGINDLRLVVDSMDHTGDNLELALSTFKARTARQLESADISFSWTQTPDFEFALTSTRDILNLYRFMQEAVSNVIRHAQAKTLDIEIRDTGELFLVTIQDDGIGLPEGKSVAGKGLANLEQRARLLGGKVDFEGGGIDGKGFGVRLTLPHTSQSNPAQL